MRRLLLLTSLLLLVTGCTDKSVRWFHPTSTQTDVARDDYECTREVKVMVKDDRVVGPLWWVMTERSRGDSRAKQYHAQCMQARGYTAQPDDTPATAQPLATPTAPPQVGFTFEQHLAQLNDLNARGLISEEEYAVMRRRLVESVTPSTLGPTAAARGLDGTFSGEITGQARGEAFTIRVIFTLVQSGDQLFGVWSTTAGTSGTVHGVVIGGQIRDFRVERVSPCEGTFTGAAAIEGGQLRGSYTGVDCQGRAVTASFTVTRQ